MSIKEFKESENFSFPESRIEIPLESNGKKYVFYATAISFLGDQRIRAEAKAMGRNLLSLMVAESITDNDGNKFSYDDITRMKEEFVKPLLEATLEVNKGSQQEKK